ncbi:MAG TPA: type II toxin-antitoxin system ParD family antitoxin [Acetobacteraceae bacterium]|nr:type II toxin-antitoxin system ParD family antitoxin [Acetobacteraceae bacterium]
MGTNVHLTAELERFAQTCVASGRFNNISEVVRSGLRLLQDAEARRAAFVASLEAAQAEGAREGLATLDEVETDIRAAIANARQRRP